ncbi:hypothetical protein [Psychrobacter sp. 16-MNA-CIBAN-0192]|uniref:hypothetical protein n=1 Tax=Psychrobacter sp. 16-MNA-CIBAN-0192 TaxID=3140448 RepID=UPI00331CAFDE
MSKDIEPDSEWLDAKGKVVKVVSIDHDSGTLIFNRPEAPKVERTVSIEKFISQVMPVGHKSESANKMPNKLVTHVWVDDSHNGFGKSLTLQLAHQDWLERGMHAKTVKFDIGQGGLAPDVNWEDKCAAIAGIDHAPAKALASILLWGSDDNWDWSRCFDEVVQYLVDIMIRRCSWDQRSEPKACSHSLAELARLMARMVLHFELYALWDVYTVKGRLRYSGIEINASTYTNAWLTYQRQMIHDVHDLIGKIDHSVSGYRHQLSAV